MQQRLPWIDAARGLCVIAVVLLHVGIFHSFELSLAPREHPAFHDWVLLNEAVLAKLRMPLLLLLSGWLARTKIQQGIGYARTRLTLLSNLHIFVVWSCVYFACGILVPFGQPDARTAPTLLRSLVNPAFGPLWFVYVLVVAMFLLAITRRLPAWSVLLGFFVLGWGVLLATGDVAGLPRAVFFAVGARYGPQLLTATRSWKTIAIAAAGYILFFPIAERLPERSAYPFGVAAGLCAAIVFLALMQAFGKMALARPAAWVGRRTLGVYVLHWPLVMGLAFLGRTQRALFQPWLQTPASAIAYDITISLAIVALCVGLESLLRRVGLGILFDPPRAAKRLATAGARTGTEGDSRPQAEVPNTESYASMTTSSANRVK